jgi:hypothetical protein
MPMPLSEEYDRRLLLLAYDVLDHMETPPEGTTDAEMCLLLSRAFGDRTAVPAKLGLPPRRQGNRV